MDFAKLLRLWPLVLVLAACAPVQRLQTPSGRPEITISGATKKQVLDLLVAEMLASGAQIKQVNEYGAVFGKRDDSFAGALLFGSRYDSTPEMRITFNVVETPGATRVFCNAAMVTNPGSAFERVTDVTGGKTANDVQAMLERLRARLEPPAARTSPSPAPQPADVRCPGQTYWNGYGCTSR